MEILENNMEDIEKKDVLEWIIETEEGEFSFTETLKIKKGPCADVVLIYSIEECKRLGIPLTKCPNAVVFYDCDMKLQVEDGFVKVTNKGEILFMMQRRLIKNIITIVNGEEMK